MPAADWSLFGATCYVESSEKPGHDIMRQFRDAVYANGIPWSLGPPDISSFNIKVLLRNMASHLTTTRELVRLFNCLDEARQHGWPIATVDAGDILVARAKGKRGTVPLPDGWIERAQFARGRGANSSAAFWAGSMLRAAGIKTPDRGHDRDDSGPAVS